MPVPIFKDENTRVIVRMPQVNPGHAPEKFNGARPKNAVIQPAHTFPNIPYFRQSRQVLYTCHVLQHFVIRPENDMALRLPVFMAGALSSRAQKNFINMGAVISSHMDVQCLVADTGTSVAVMTALVDRFGDISDHSVGRGR